MRLSLLHSKKHLVSLLMILVFSNESHSQGWVDDYFDNATSTGPNSYRNQQRGFYSAGTFSARRNVSVENPITIALPSISAGCGGIDMFLGGFSFLDSDYLVQKYQGIIQAAPALAFSMALKTLSKELEESGVKLEAATNWINNIQLDECAMANRVVTEVKSDDPNVLGGLWNEMTGDVSLRDSINRSWDETQNDIDASDGAPPLDLREEIRDCPAQYKRLVAAGSFIENIASEYGLTAQADLIRGYVGDVIITAGPSNRIPQSQRIQGCPANELAGIDDLLYGYAQIKTIAGVCQTNDTPARDRVANELTSIISSVVAGTALTPDQVNFISVSPIPLLPTLIKAYANDTLNYEIQSSADVVAAAYVYHMVNDMYRNIVFALDQAETASKPVGIDPSATGSNLRCNTRLYEKTFADFRAMRDKLRFISEGVKTAYIQKLNEQLAMLGYANHKRNEGDRIFKDQQKTILDRER